MPNYMTSRLTVQGEGGADLLLSLCEKDENGQLAKDAGDGEYYFDFNKIIPMPKSLDIVCGGVTDECMKVYVNSLMEGCPAFQKYKTAYLKCRGSELRGFQQVIQWKMSEEEYQRAIANLMENYSNPNETPYFKTKADMYAYGKKALDNYLIYGSKDWYDWCCTHWGTKWNAMQSVIEGNTVTFYTAWSDVRALMCVLSAQHPEFTFFYEYAEEETGFYTGKAEYKDGQEMWSESYEDYSKEAYELSFDLNGGREDYEWDEESHTYKRIDGD